MRCFDSNTEALFAYVTPESFFPKDHPLRAIRKMADEALAGMDKLFDSMYATTGRSSEQKERESKALSNKTDSKKRTAKFSKSNRAYFQRPDIA